MASRDDALAKLASNTNTVAKLASNTNTVAKLASFDNLFSKVSSANKTTLTTHPITTHPITTHPITTSIIKTTSKVSSENNTATLSSEKTQHSKSKTKSYDSLPFRHVISIGNKVPPVNSYGLIPHNVTTNKWLLVQRRYSPSFFILIQGNYRDADLVILLNELTIMELETIKMMVTNPKTIPEILYRFNGGANTQYCEIRFASENIKKLINTVKGQADGEWLFPSGRPSGEDKSVYETAIREYHEEGGINPQFFNIKNLIPEEIIEKIETAIIRNHRHYYPYIIYGDDPISSLKDDPEIIQAKWVSEIEASMLLNPNRFKYLLSTKKYIDDYLKMKKTVK
ncbi:MAG: hypothetical protein Solumvirus3_21 [Solumvirus sp.]|uniref:Nudix hydrolase domain-containing protein n=1 Tax=Solumvirus sp. TaxID=2487773 RepID=A0A3G5AGE3_9VIRU|nr:MAG: hypothetical protein Solumvirus3_21 [Solumvirus sp.]